MRWLMLAIVLLLGAAPTPRPACLVPVPFHCDPPPKAS